VKNFTEEQKKVEKFGIFNILSALGNLAEEKGETAKKEEESAPAPPAPAPAERAGIFTGEERMNKMLSVLERHDMISRRIDSRKPPR